MCVCVCVLLLLLAAVGGGWGVLQNFIEVIKAQQIHELERQAGLHDRGGAMNAPPTLRLDMHRAQLFRNTNRAR